MKNIILLFAAISFSISSIAQLNAVTETGDEVLLFDNGSWSYKNEELATNKEIPVSNKKYFKSKDASFLLKSKKFNVGFWLNPKKWSFTKAENNPEAEYELTLKEEDLYGALITEKIEVPIEVLKDIALENAKSVAPDIKVVKEEIRTVNGIKVLLMQMEGSSQGIKFTFNGYYYSNSGGTAQFVLYTATNLWKDYAEEAEELLNGFVLLD